MHFSVNVMARTLTVALCLCFILLFGALWHLPSHKFPHVPPPLKRKSHSKTEWQSIESPGEASDLLNTFSSPMKDRQRDKPSIEHPWGADKTNSLLVPKNPSISTTKSGETQKPLVNPSTDNLNGFLGASSTKSSSSVAPTLKNKAGPVLILFWSTWFGKRLALDKSWRKGACPVECKVTSDVTRADDANAFIVHARDPYPLPPRNDVPWILYTQENPVYTPDLEKPDYMSKFKLLKSYRLDSDFPDPTFTVPNFSPPVPFGQKTGNIMAAFSNCERVRMEYMRQLVEFVEVDSYGACYKNTWGLIHRDGSEDFREQKTEMARKYKFLLVFFNQDCDYFVDDQLVHALNAGTVPVVLGTDKIDEFMPGNLRNAYINVHNFKSPRRLAERLKFLGNNESEYNKYLEWKFKGFGDINATTIGKHFYPKYPPYCQVCDAVAKGKVHKGGLKPIYCQPRRFEDWGIKMGATAEEITK